MPATSVPIFRDEQDLATRPASERIRYRLVGADCRFHANDNISAFVKDGELDELKAEVQAKMQEVLSALVIDTESEIARLFAVDGMPSGYLLDADGRVREIHIGYKSGDEIKLAESIRKLLLEMDAT